MERNYRMVFSAIIVTLPLFFAVPSEAGTICVNPNNAPPCQPTIQDGVNAANVGDTVKIAGGTYPEFVRIPAAKPDITLAGVGQVIIASPNGDDIKVEANNVTIKDLTTQGGNHGIHLQGVSGAHIRRVHVQGPGGACIFLRNASDVEIVDSELYDCNDDGVGSTQGSNPNLVVRNTTITGFGSGSGDAGIEVRSDNHAQLIDNTIDGQGQGGDCIEVSGAAAVVRGNKVSNCNREGIEVRGDNPIITGNVVTVANRKGYDIRCSASCGDGLVNKNAASHTSDDGFDITSNSGVLLVKKNLASESDRRGFILRSFGSGRLDVRKNRALDSGSGGTDDSGFKIEAENSILKKNKANGSSADGFNIRASHVQLILNSAKGNLEDGFDVRRNETFVSLIKNTANLNTFEGIEVDTNANFTTVENNTAKDNLVDFCDAGTNTTASGNNFGTTQSGSCPN